MYFFSVILSVLTHTTYLPMFLRVAWLSLGQSYGCPSASEATLNDMVKTDWCQTRMIHRNAWTMYIFLGMYCIVRDRFCLKDGLGNRGKRWRFEEEIINISNVKELVGDVSLCAPFEMPKNILKLSTIFINITWSMKCYLYQWEPEKFRRKTCIFL